MGKPTKPPSSSTPPTDPGVKELTGKLNELIDVIKGKEETRRTERGAEAEARRAEATEKAEKIEKEKAKRKQELIEDRNEELREVEAEVAAAKAELEELEKKQQELGIGAQITNYERYLDLQTQELDLKKKKLQNDIKQYKVQLQLDRLEERDTKDTLDKIKIAEQQVADITKEAKALSEKVSDLKPGFEAGASAAKKMFSAIGGGENSFSTFFKKFENFKGSYADLGKAFGSSFIEQTGEQGMLLASNVLVKSYELSKEMNQVFADTKKEFGVDYGEKLNNVFMKSERSLRQYGISAKETVAISKSLNSTFSDFIDMGEKEQRTLMKNAAVMQKVGVSNEEYADSLKFLEFSMGETREATQENIAELVEFGRRNGIEGKSTIANFKKVRSYMAQFGDNWQKTFNRMSLISRKTGMDIDNLASIAQGFDTFEGAAESVGKLNALLGGPFLNTVDMIRTEDPAEQIMKVKQAFDAAGKSVNSMTKFELKGFAETIPGINGDVEKMRTLLNKLDSGMLSSADAITEALEGPSDEQKRLDQQLKASTSIAESLAIVSNSLALMTPILEVVNPFFQLFANVVTGLGDAFPRLAIGIGKSVYYFSKWMSSSAKSIPIIGTIISAVSIVDRLMRGDVTGALLEAGAAAAAFAGPGVGAAAQAGIVAYDLAGGEQNSLNNWFNSGNPVRSGYGQGVDDFIYRGNGTSGNITPINSKDQFLGLKDGGPAQAGLKEVMEGISRGNTSYETSIQNKTESDFVRNNINNASNNITPNINLTVMLEGRELRAFVKQVIADNLNPLK